MDRAIIKLLLACGAVVSLSMGIRHGFGFFLPPLTQEFGWSREAFAFAIGLQNLVWGMAQPFAGAFADRHGPGRVLTVGALLYALGLALMTLSATPWLFAGSAGLVLGLALSCTTYSVVFGVVGRVVPAAYRSRAMGLTAAAGSFGQFVMVPAARGMIDGFGWLPALLILAAMSLLMLPFAQVPASMDVKPPQAASAQHSMLAGMARVFALAWQETGFRLLMVGYFVCGFQVVFIGVHLPAYLKDHGMSGAVASLALALIGLFNIFGTFTAGELGSRLSKPHLLAAIYITRTIVIALFLLFPLSQLSVALFASAIGFLWLSTVPLTNGVLASQFGVQHLGLLSGAVFFSHQVGSFLGVWLGGLLYDISGSYSMVWGLAMVLGVVAALSCLPIREQPSRVMQAALA